MIDELFERELRNTSINGVSLADYIKENYIPKTDMWIPVSEGMPKENETVIASTKYGVYPEAHYTKKYGWEWAYEAGVDYWEALEDVTAWMPLPEPYDTWSIKRDADTLEKSLEDHIKENYIPKEDMWSIKEVADALEKHGLIGR